MIDSIDKFSPRFIHMPNLPGDCENNGTTVAYVRDNSHVFFAWSQVSPNDQYSKPIGRTISAGRLALAIPDMKLLTQVPGTGHLYLGTFVGFIDATFLASSSRVTSTIADHILEKLTPMDYKHSLITTTIAGLLYAW